MKKIVSALVLAGLVGASGVVMAEEEASPLSANITLTTDYVFRGVSQTQNGPAIQGGVDYSHPSGFYLGTWASNVGWVSTGFKSNNSMEIDLYGGYRATLAEDFGLDVGVITYYYPGNQIAGANDPDTTEIYLGGSWKFLSAKYSYTASNQFVGWGTEADPTAKTQGSYYVEAAANYDFGDGWGALAHVGYQSVKDNSPASYTDWKLAVSKDVGFGVFALAYTDTNADTAPYTWSTSGLGDSVKKVAGAKGILSFSKSF